MLEQYTALIHHLTEAARLAVANEALLSKSGREGLLELLSSTQGRCRRNVTAAERLGVQPAEAKRV